MIYISGSSIDYDSVVNQYPLESIEKKIIDILLSSSYKYTYNSLSQLKFELELRKNIISTSVNLHKSMFSFRVFRESKCNTNYWERTNEGGFSLKNEVKPSDAIKDILVNSAKYGTECSTAIVIVYYGAVVNVFPEEVFNRVFSHIYLMDWQYLDRSLEIHYYEEPIDYLPGDCRYFKNPDVDPLTPEWQGENAIDLGNGMYYGHGIGIKDRYEMIAILNMHRVSGSQTSAYLMESLTRPSFKILASYVPSNGLL